jgi:hypothetical protein
LILNTSLKVSRSLVEKNPLLTVSLREEFSAVVVEEDEQSEET